ncbi:tetratricopeptide repeat protein [Candidatus Uabimicrobium amorphum]|uniref:MalT-like TPR region domain-containing protein n=1 Tax=Uabimicrobium amorphum TaxID=2596890 RepID=A0A5S9IKG1_UABAM|nr:tetratricopeptide repeat protein [Candidatus Uabimicrobium amorphum]BBM83519.1 hypothetical protein UABAM_01871 [Candidatus Uabimicrobium amorphum]
MLENVCRLLKQRKLAVFTGAGISIDAPSSIPGWQQLINAMVHALTTHHEDLKGLDEDIVSANIAPEVISQILYESIGEEYLSTFEVLKNRKPNHHHIYLSKLAKSGFVSFFVTANLDTCLEDAMENEGMERDKDYFVYATEADFESFMDFPQYSGVRIFKIHGSVENLHSIITTFSKEGQGLSKNKVRLLRCLLLIRHFLFIGYSGNDLNANPNYIMLEDLTEEAKGFYWNFLPEEDIHKQVERLIDLYDKRSAALQFSGVDLLQKLWEYVDGESFVVVEKKDEGFDYATELQKWCAASEVTGGVYHALGALLRHVAQNDKATQCYTKAIEHYRERSNINKLCQATCDLGSLLHFQGKDSEAEKVYKDLLREFEKQQTAEKAFIYEGLANLALDNGSVAKSKEYYEQALEIVEESGHFAGTAHLLIRLGNFHKSQGEWQLARKYYQQSTILAEEIWSYKLLVDIYSRVGDLELHQGKWNVAEQNYRKGIKIAEETGYELGCADLYNSLGMLKRKSGQLDTARDWLEKSLQMREKLASPSGIINCHISLAQLYEQSGEWEKAEEYIHAAMSTAEKYQITVGLALCYRALAAIMQKRGEYEQALENLAKSEDIERKFNRLPSLASVLSQQAIVYEKQSLYEKAHKLYNECLDIFRTMNNRPAMAASYNNLAVLASKQRETDTAFELYQKSQKISEEIGDKVSLSSCFINMSVILQVKGDWQQAEEFLHKSLEYSKGINLLNEGNAYSNLAILHQKRQKLQIAEDFLHKSVTIFEKLNNAPMLSSIYRKVATLHQQKKEWSTAEDFIKRALEVSQDKNLQMEIAENYRTSGLIYADQDKLAEALKELNSSLQIYQEKNNAAQIAQNYRLIANIHRRKEDWDIAKEFYLDAIKIQEQIKDKTSLAHTYVQMGHLHREQGNIEESENAFVAAKDIYEHTNNKRKTMDTVAHIGNLMVKCKNFSVALQNYRHSLKIAKELGDELEIANAQFNMSFILRKSGNKDEAIRLLEKSAKVYEKRQKIANLRKAEKMLRMWKKKKNE